MRPNDRRSSAFDALMALGDTPMWVVTTADGVRRAGCLVGFATQISIEPRRFLVGLSKANYTYTVAQHSEHLAVHLLAPEGVALAQLFGSETGHAIDKFGHCEWHTGPNSMPILVGAAGWFVGRIVGSHDLGDHVGFLLAVTAAAGPDDGARALRYHDVAMLQAGTAP
ncbi:flavin reductase family protein [Nocardia stercoris]|uniref:Flavin reductase n=1 Tax=Nocardia stercoris TaxID=2483361 RepID=A0A3M2L0P7_9NOCA|nr:flavin reductase family protein [Nocardia stercoris]RMI31299.1 flavin reductase [Nocardia stercoris]